MTQPDKSEYLMVPEEHLRRAFFGDEIVAHSGAVLSYNDKVDLLYLALSAMPQVEMETKHLLTPGLYTREATAPAGSMLISKTHRKEHQFIMSKGVCHSVTEMGEIVKLVAPYRGVTKPGTRRVCFIESDTTWTSIHATQETDIQRIEAELYEEDRLLISDNPDHIDFYAMARDLGVSAERIRAESRKPDTLMPMPAGEGVRTEVRESKIEGLGFFATEWIPSGDKIAPAAINRMRTPAGRYTNHSATPNAVLAANPDGSVDLVALTDIASNQEITLDYRQAHAIAILSSRLLNKP